ncbi:hypothetical protein [Clostridium ganghwense]|uniref:CPBP family intramembrane metalloprotease n=1 Tax=Clostridium ganghwense TaxID=312089 RepID=A0ABT4CRE1_9CLOT|nr:hypothetical protein [Clostridium ganghwense]MCY6371493.1 hypothetical protein [Clostridium ganghwense]
MYLLSKKKQTGFIILLILYVILAFVGDSFPLNSFYRSFYRTISYLIYIVFSLVILISPRTILEFSWNSEKKMDIKDIVIYRILGGMGLLYSIYRIIQLW